MKEELVSLEVALLLKELGFDWRVLFAYGKKGELSKDDLRIHELDNFNFYKGTYYQVSAPTQSLAQKWLRDVKETYVGIDRWFVNGVFEYQASFSFSIESVDHDVMSDYPTYEQALEAGLLASLNYLQTKNKKENV